MDVKMEPATTTETPSSGVGATPSGSSTAAAPSSSSATASPSTTTSSSTAGAEETLLQMNQSFAKCLTLVCPPIQYPPHCRFNPVQQDAADTQELESRLEDFFLFAKQIELVLINRQLKQQQEEVEEEEDEPAPSLVSAAKASKKHELLYEIAFLENELTEKNDLIDKYAEVLRGWEGKFKRLGNRLSPERD